MIWSIDDLPSRIVPPAELQFAEQLVVGPPTWFGAGQCGTPAEHLPPNPRPARPGPGLSAQWRSERYLIIWRCHCCCCWSNRLIPDASHGDVITAVRYRFRTQLLCTVYSQTLRYTSFTSVWLSQCISCCLY